MPQAKALILAGHFPCDELTTIAGSVAPHALPIGNRPLVSFAVSAAREAGVDDLAIVVSAESCPHVQTALQDFRGEDLHWIVTPEPLDFAAALAAGAPFLDSSPFIVLSGDAILLHPLAPLLGELLAGAAEAIILTRGHATLDRRRPSVINGDAHPSDNASALAGAHLFGPRALSMAQAMGAPSGPAELAARLARTGGPVQTRSVDGSWIYDGTIDQLLEANRMVLDELRGDRRVRRGDGLRIEGRVTVDPSAQIENTTIRGPAVIGRRAVLRDAFIGPYSAIGEDVRIESAEIEHSIVLAGATIRRPGVRLEASLIGKGAKVTRDFDLSSSLRLRVGEHTEVRLA